MKLKFLLVLFVATSVVSCGSIKEIPYFQNMETGDTISLTENQVVRTQPNDQLSILVNSKDPMLADLFNLPVGQRRVGSNNGNGSAYSQYISCYTIDEKGEIDFKGRIPWKHNYTSSRNDERGYDLFNSK